MTIELSAHLSVEAMNDVLIGLGSPESETHLLACQACRAQLQSFNSDIRLFNRTTLKWSEMQSATMPSPIPAPRPRLGIFAPAGLALTASILLATGILAWHHNPGASQNFANTPTATQQDDPVQIATDNELMRSVDMALSAGEAAPLGELRIAQRPHPRLKTRPAPDAITELRNR